MGFAIKVICPLAFTVNSKRGQPENFLEHPASARPPFSSQSVTIRNHRKGDRTGENDLLIERPEIKCKTIAVTDQSLRKSLHEFIDSLLGRELREAPVTSSGCSPQDNPLFLNDFTHAELGEFVIRLRSLGIQCYPKFS
jgi:hypothetical protein